MNKVRLREININYSSSRGIFNIDAIVEINEAESIPLLLSLSDEFLTTNSTIPKEVQMTSKNHDEIKKFVNWFAQELYVDCETELLKVFDRRIDFDSHTVINILIDQLKRAC